MTQILDCDDSSRRANSEGYSFVVYENSEFWGLMGQESWLSEGWNHRFFIDKNSICNRISWPIKGSLGQN